MAAAHDTQPAAEVAVHMDALSALAKPAPAARRPRRTGAAAA